MSAIEIILILSLIGGIGAMAGGALLLLGKKASENVVHVLVSFAAGSLLGVTFFELLPEAIEYAEEAHTAGGIEINVFVWTLGGMLFFYLLDRGIHWFQYHQKMRSGF